MNKQNENEYKKSINSYKFIPSSHVSHSDIVIFIHHVVVVFFYILYHYEVQTRK